MKTFAWTTVALSLVAACFIGCEKASQKPESTTATTPPETNTTPAAAADPTYRLSGEPEGGQDVIQVREAAKNDDEVVIVGRIGGSENPWIDGRAAFSIVDPSLKACSDIPGDNCPKPWDYCCETDNLPTSTALVKFVDDQGKLVESDARELLKVKELQTVVIQGKAQRDDAGNLTVLASGIFVKE